VGLRHEFRKQWMLSASYGYQRARYLTTRFDDRTLVNAPEHLASFKGIAPLIPEVALLALRVTFEASRRITLAASDNTKATVIVDATLSGTFKGFGLRYTAGVYNLADERTLVPVSATFTSRTMPQNGRTLLFDLNWTFQ
jgi:outer membrane receptor protein involved in Fe transport